MEDENISSKELEEIYIQLYKKLNTIFGELGFDDYVYSQFIFLMGSVNTLFTLEIICRKRNEEVKNVEYLQEIINSWHQPDLPENSFSELRECIERLFNYSKASRIQLQEKILEQDKVISQLMNKVSELESLKLRI